MISLTPAKLLGIDKETGSIGEGKRADLLIFNENIDISHVMVRGELVMSN
jgi:N-acetylglucosamine-6-phosphate deacetylase